MWPFNSPTSKQAYQPLKTEELEDSEISFELDKDGRSPSPSPKQRKSRTRFNTVIGLLSFILLIIFLIGVGILLTSSTFRRILGDTFNPKSTPSPSPSTAFDKAPITTTSPSPVLDLIPFKSSSPSSSSTTSSIPTSSTPPTSEPTSTACPLRREWRTLTTDEKQTYITAVKCLLNQPSQLHPPHNSTANSTLYTDFPFIHAHIGYSTHNSAAFLPWHRYFLHIYELALAEKCNYHSGLVYWDWTLDSLDLPSSPVFSATTGFGGDGNHSLPVTLGNSGRCVTDGPFGAGPDGVGVWGQYYDVKYKPHCLSRGFRNDEGDVGVIVGSDVSPESIEGVLGLDKYEEFVVEMEAKVHDAIPFGVGGDFETFTAPYDPLFYLHHTQLDRLWYLWQQRDPTKRLDEYNGHKARHSIEMANINDEIKMGGWREGIKVWQVMDTQGKVNGGDWDGYKKGWSVGEGVRVHTAEKGLGRGLLCYRYE